uniref:Uncharacterized protein n=1 Tax=Panagrolaimus davidi TaxID=227884 RepID=A0A914RCF0_9BILA
MLTEVNTTYNPPPILSEIEKHQMQCKRQSETKKKIEKFREQYGEQAGGGRPKGSQNKQQLSNDHMYMTVAEMYYENFDLFIDKTDRHADILQQQNKVWKDIENALEDDGVSFSAQNLRANFQKFVEELILQYESTQQSFKSTGEEDLGAEDILQQLGRGKRHKKNQAVWTPASNKRNVTSMKKRKRIAYEALAESEEDEEEVADEEDENMQDDLSSSLPSRSNPGIARNSNNSTSPMLSSVTTPRASSSNLNKRKRRKRNAYEALAESEEDEEASTDEEEDILQADLSPPRPSRSNDASARNSSNPTPRTSAYSRSSAHNFSQQNSTPRRTNSRMSDLFGTQSLPRSPRNSLHSSARNVSGSNASSSSDLASQISKTTSGPAKKSKKKEYDELTELSRTVGSAAKAQHMQILQKVQQDRETADTKKMALDQLMRQNAEKRKAELKRIEQQSELERIQLDTEFERNRKAKAEAEAAELQVKILQKQLQNK